MSSGKRWRRIGAALVCSVVLVVETRDLYHRAVWRSTTPTMSLQLCTGDVLFVSNRWYALPWPSHALYSLACKALWKTSWDEVAVVVRGGRTRSSSSWSASSSATTGAAATASRVALHARNGSSARNDDDDDDDMFDDDEPRVLYCDMTGVHTAPLCAFLAARVPRGVAVRHLRRSACEDDGVDGSNNNNNNSNNNRHNEDDEAAVVRALVRRLTTLPAQPWYALRASLRWGDAETDVYRVGAELHKQRVRLREMAAQRCVTPHAAHEAQTRLRELALAQQRLREHRRGQTPPPHEAREGDAEGCGALLATVAVPHMTNGALVASLLAVLGVLPCEAPPLSYYTAADFAADLPLTGTHVLAQPTIFFAT